MAQPSADLEDPHLLIAKVISIHQTDKNRTRGILRDKWRRACRIDSFHVSGNIYKFCFQSKEVRDLVIREQPWTVLKNTVALAAGNDDMTLEELDLDHVLFWVQVHGVPMRWDSEQGFRRLLPYFCNIFTKEPLYDFRSANRGYLRIRCVLNTSNPFPLGFDLERQDLPTTWISFKYERLEDICYHCGRLGHLDTHCEFEPKALEEDYRRNFGKHMKQNAVVSLPEIFRAGPPVRQPAALPPRRNPHALSGSSSSGCAPFLNSPTSAATHPATSLSPTQNRKTCSTSKDLQTAPLSPAGSHDIDPAGNPHLFDLLKEAVNAEADPCVKIQRLHSLLQLSRPADSSPLPAQAQTDSILPTSPTSQAQNKPHAQSKPFGLIFTAGSSQSTGPAYFVQHPDEIATHFPQQQTEDAAPSQFTQDHADAIVNRLESLTLKRPADSVEMDVVIRAGNKKFKETFAFCGGNRRRILKLNRTARLALRTQTEEVGVQDDTPPEGDPDRVPQEQ